MNALAWILLVVAALGAVVDWVAVWRRPRWDRVETVLKPLVLVALIGVALVIDAADEGQRAWFVAGLVLSLAGDVFLLPTVDRFVPGLASFLLAHLAYLAGFVAAGRGDVPMAGVLVLLLGMSFVAVRVVRAVSTEHRDLLAPVLVYIAAIGWMLVAAWWHGAIVGIAGAGAFVVSDSILATERFVDQRRWMPLAVMVTYHVAQALLVLSLVR